MTRITESYFLSTSDTFLVLKKKSERKSVFHTDYLSVIDIEDVNWKSRKKIEIEKAQLAYLLGMSFLMARGTKSSRLASNTLSGITLPVINPLQILEDTLISKGDNFVLSPELGVHKGQIKQSSLGNNKYI